MRNKNWLGPRTLLVVALFLLTSPSLDADKKREREKSLLRETSDQYLRRWLQEDVLYIITEDERAAFQRFTTDEERYQFIEQFWIRRDPSPDTIENEARDEHYRRIAYANEHFASGKPGWKTDRGRIYITWGPPDQIEPHPGGSYQRPVEEGGGITSAYPFEVWRYRHLDGDDLGNEILVEFVDKTMSGEYAITIDPSEKDALLNVPGAGPTDLEAMRLADKSERFNNTDGTRLGRSLFGNSLRMNPFDRLRQRNALDKAPPVKFKDLETMVNTKLSFNLLPFAFRTDFIKLTEDTVLTPVTIQLQHKDLTFESKDGVQHAAVNIFGRVTTLSGRIVQRFEDVVVKDVPESLYGQTLEQSSLYWKALPLRSGLYKLELVLKDLKSGNVGTTYQGFTVPEYRAGKLATSSLILADKIEKLPLSQVTAGQFVIGGSKVLPNVGDRFRRNTTMGLYFQVYNLGVDETSHKPSVSVEYVLRKGDQEVARFSEERDRLSGAAEQMTLEKLLTLDSLEPGSYRLTVDVTDKLSRRSVSQSAKFEVR